ncbi:MAG: signal peptidase II [Candidatus Dasytiphilus stammeri]
MKNINFYFPYLWIISSIFCIDFFSKQWIKYYFNLKEKVWFYPEINILYTSHYGSFFSYLVAKNKFLYWFWIIIILFIIILLLIIIARNSNNLDYFWNNIALALIVGGGLSNLSDRIIYGSVIDFIHCFIMKWNFLTFNIADISICIGGFLMILLEIKFNLYLLTRRS